MNGFRSLCNENSAGVRMPLSVFFLDRQYADCEPLSQSSDFLLTARV
jgi:hypothetical protein